MEDRELEQIEMELVIKALNNRYGYDFYSYSKASVYRRLSLFCEKKNYIHISSVIPDLLRNPDLMSELVQYLSIPVSEMFRDPGVFKYLRDEVLPLLKSYSSVKIWTAGCATGEEAYSLAILCCETGLYERVKIYATDFNDSSLNIASKGIYDIKRVKDFIRNYQNSGGIEDFSNYYHAGYDSVIMNEQLKKKIIFTNHNLVCDSSFGEMNLVLCRNVLIYFNTELQNRVLKMLTDSIVRSGYLCIGTKESLAYSNVNEYFDMLDHAKRIYKKKKL